MYTLAKHLDEKVARLHLAALGVKLTELSSGQVAYLGVPVDGPAASRTTTGTSRTGGSAGTAAGPGRATEEMARTRLPEHEVADLGLAPAGAARIAWAAAQMPVLAQIRERFAAERPLDGIRVGPACT